MFFFFFREEKGRRKSATVLLLSRGAVFLPVKEGKRIERGEEDRKRGRGVSFKVLT